MFESVPMSFRAASVLGIAATLGSEARVTRLLFVWGVHQAAYVAGLVGTVLATIWLRRWTNRDLLATKG